MKDNEKLLLLALLGAGAWWYYTRTNRLTLAGHPENPMLPPPSYGSVVRSPLSPVQASNSTSTAATNVVAGIANTFAQLWGRTVGRGPGNSPVNPAATATGIDAATIGRPASGFPTLAIAPPALGDVVPYWMVDANFAVPSDNDFSTLLWSVPPEMSYIAPPPPVSE